MADIPPEDAQLSDDLRRRHSSDRTQFFELRSEDILGF